ncbi:MAG: cupredoxin domain-containing protein [Chloroflexota bacterium]|nr:cupredoxin domain-containing protein [Chloroflexota bacterium]
MGKWEIAAIALVLLVIVGTPVAVFTYQSSLRSQQENEFTLVGHNGQWGPDVIRVTEGETVRLRLTSADVVHGFALKAYGIEVDEVYPGKVKTIEFVADKPGTFLFACTIVCHPGHRHMEGEIIVEAQGGPPVVLAEE